MVFEFPLPELQVTVYSTNPQVFPPIVSLNPLY